MQDEKTYSNIEVKNTGNSEVEVRGEITEKASKKYRDAVIKELISTTEVQGFRKGHVPEHVLIQKVGEQTIMEKTAGQALERAYIHILEEHKIDAVGNPQISITKLAPNNPIGFTIKTTTYPRITLPNYKEIAQNTLEKRISEEISVSDKELDEAILQIRKSTAKSDSEKENPPEITDELVKQWNFKDADDFKAKMRGDMQREKEMREKEKIRISITDAILEKTKLAMPEIFISSELEKMMTEFKGNISRMGLSYDEYLKKINKNEEDLRNEWKPQAEKRAKMQLLLHEISEEEKIVADPEKIESEMKHVLEHHKDADPNRVKTYIETLLKNEKVFEFLEKQGE